ncbi:MTH538 TIR-like domain (DUF1863) [Seminavis robusta]|uniref:MTH538 TIR-like domain (DUF1863) n=1 Tax=Seminavis robusta TaxID=568900 RepID=A0A9N8DU06_9STRA|nr:MTH538 TIR-like domain (DUF1863) [Seminavis robusta]|eukprot:Sro355_g125090.1 MTH538 TIR-like domain (DUF1863) (345) ;mRNA; r:35206-36240
MEAEEQEEQGTLSDPGVEAEVARFQAVVVGQESIPNLRLSNILRKLLGKENVHRYLEIKHLLEFLADHYSVASSDSNLRMVGIFYDIFSLEPLTSATDTIGYIRTQYPEVVFCLYLCSFEEDRFWGDLPFTWRTRLQHYYTLYKEQEQVPLEPSVREILYDVIHEAMTNARGYQTTISKAGNVKTLVRTDLTAESGNSVGKKGPLFISYSRRDWEDFVLPLINQLHDKKYRVWVDQNLLVGGDDWMDKIGEALDHCKALILVMSPDSLSSKYVKMEYRYFFNHDKLIIPILHRPVDRIPPELGCVQHVDFCRNASLPNNGFAESCKKLFKVLEEQLVESVSQGA